MRSRLAAPAALVLAGSLMIAACGDDDDDAAGTDGTTQAPAAVTAETPAGAPTSMVEITQAPATEASAGTAVESGAAAADFNDADVVFAQGMIAHHEQAIEMADIALDPNIGASPEVQDLATRIKGAQEPEIELMTEWLSAWGETVQMDASGGHDMSSMEGVMSAEEMDALGAASGTEFDTMWLEMMVRHHEGAVAMAETVKASGSNADVLGLADQIITAQLAEIEEMQTLLNA